MNKSQVRATIGLIATIVGSVGTAVLPVLQTIPESPRAAVTVLSVLIAIAGGVTTALNASLHPGHKSIPTERAKELGLLDVNSGTNSH